MKNIPTFVTIVGLCSGAIGIYFIFTNASITFGTAQYSPAPLLLLFGAISIVAGLATTSQASTSPPPNVSWWSRTWPIILGVVLLVVFFSQHYQPSDKEKYELLVDLTLIIIGITAAVGYGMFKWISRNIQEGVDAEKQTIIEIQTLIKARVKRNAGYIFWSMFDVVQKGKSGRAASESSEYKKDLLELAITQAKDALKIVQKLPKDKYENSREFYLCINNLIYYQAEIYKYEISKLTLSGTEKEEALDLVKEILQETSKEIFPEDYYDCQESAAWAKFHLSEGDEKSKEKACEIIRKLLDDDDIPPAWREGKKKQWKKYLQTEVTETS